MRRQQGLDLGPQRAVVATDLIEVGGTFRGRALVQGGQEDRLLGHGLLGHGPTARASAFQETMRNRAVKPATNFQKKRDRGYPGDRSSPGRSSSRRSQARA